MTAAELEALCSRENFSLDDGRAALELVESLTEPHPTGIGMPRDRVGDIMEAAAGLTNALYDNPAIGAPYYATAVEMVNLMKRLGAPRKDG